MRRSLAFLLLLWCGLGVSSAWAQSQLIAGNRVIVGSLNFCADAGSTDAYACSLSPAITTYRTGTRYTFTANTANTGAATLNLNGLGAKTIKKVVGGITIDLTDNDIRVGQIVDVIYDGTNMQMLSQVGHGPIAQGTAVLSTSAISSGTCAAAVTVSAPGVLTTDVIHSNFNADPTGVTGYSAATTGMLTIVEYPTANNVNFRQCNNTAASITPGAATLNFQVTR
jgi:hypothetical protein